MRIGYRTKQFWNALQANPAPEQLVIAEETLNPELLKLFRSMQPSEQVHSLQIAEALVAQGEKDPDLLTAALLHDVGKTRYPLTLFERVEIVLAHAIIPKMAKEWGSAQPSGWRRPFVVSAQHPAWGAEMAAQSGASSLAVEIIRCHQQKIDDSFSTSNSTGNKKNRLLYHLQLLDDEN